MFELVYLATVFVFAMTFFSLLISSNLGGSATGLLLLLIIGVLIANAAYMFSAPQEKIDLPAPTQAHQPCSQLGQP